MVNLRTAVLEYKDVRLTIDSNIKDCTIYCDDVIVGKGTPFVIEYLAQGKHVIMLSHEDYGEATKEININNPNDRSLTIILKQKGTLPSYPYSFFQFAYGQLWFDDGPVFGNMNYVLDDNISRQMALVGNSFNIGYILSFIRTDISLLFLHGDNYSLNANNKANRHNFESLDLMLTGYFNFSVNKYILNPLGVKNMETYFESNNHFMMFLTDIYIDVGLAYDINLYRNIQDIPNKKDYLLTQYFHYTSFYFAGDVLLFF